MRVAVRKIPGVDSVRVSLNEGLAVIHFNTDNRATVANIREAVRRNGFTPKAAEVRVLGTLTQRDGQWLLVLPDSGQRFVLRDAAGALERLGAARNRTVVVEGRVPETNAYVLEVRRVELDSSR